MSSASATGDRSGFVTALAWVLIVFSGFSVFIGSIQNLFIHILVPTSKLDSALARTAHHGNIPAFAEFMFGNFKLILSVYLALSVATLISSIGLLKRGNWARLVIIGLMYVMIIGNIGGFILQLSMFDDMAVQVGVGAPALFETMMNVMMVFSALVVLAISGLCAFIIFKLSSEPIRREFA